MFDAQITRLGNWVTRLRKVRVRPEELLLLFPHCLQWSKCPHNILADLENCRHCGKCKISELIQLAERMGIQIFVASGGRQAVKRVRQENVKAIVAVACEKEIREGLFATFPKPVIGVVNLRPSGPCVDTDCNMLEVESALREFLLPKVEPA